MQGVMVAPAQENIVTDFRWPENLLAGYKAVTGDCQLLSSNDASQQPDSPDRD